MGWSPDVGWGISLNGSFLIFYLAATDTQRKYRIKSAMMGIAARADVLYPTIEMALPARNRPLHQTLINPVRADRNGVRERTFGFCYAAFLLRCRL